MAKTIFIRILTWLGIMAGLTLLAMLLWMLVFHGSQTTESLKWFQLLQTLGTFLIPPILCAWIWDANHRPFTWLQMDRAANGKIFLFAIAIMVVALPGINLLADLNSRVELPKNLDFIEQIMRQMEENAAALTERFLKADNIAQLLLNVGLLALLPALAEELSFRGTLQQILRGEGLRVTGYRTHTAIWITAFVFSAIHMQFYGFVPRMLMGALFGYMFVWTGSLWVPVVMHFTNNAIAVVTYYVVEHSAFSNQYSDKNIADTFGAGDTWYIGVLSLIAAIALIMWLLTSQDLPGYVRRTRKQ
jgi:membrane protease YdiL (CAAX protease family)